MSGPRRERGVALVTALLIVALATVTAVSFAMQQQFDIRRTGNLIDGAQAWEYAKGGEEWAKLILRRDRRPDIDALVEAWAQPLPPIDLPGGHMVGRITDAQARFNINNLAQQGNPAGGAGNGAQLQFRRLLVTLGLDPRLMWPIIDWMDQDINPVNPAGAEDDFYSGLDHPYRTANQPMTSISELRLVMGFNAKVYQRLEPFITALPASTLINVNTAPPEVMMTLAPGMDPKTAVALVKYRQENPFTTAEDFINAVQTVAGITLPTGSDTSLGVTTQFFEVRIETSIGHGRAELNSLLVRESDEIRVLRRTQGF
ncbi:MAG: type II secretion system minor pseudopilin GspK [Gammaproteobacteria bacterium]